MKPKLFSAFLLFSVSAFVFLGCTTSCTRDGESAVNTLDVVAGYTPDTGMWSAGISITFKHKPKIETIAALAAAGATNTTDRVFTIPNYDRHNEAQSKALELSLKEGAVLKKAK